MVLVMFPLILIYQIGFVVLQCQNGFYNQGTKCEECGLLCKTCGNPCFQSLHASCPKEMLAYNNCSENICSNSHCTTCPDGYYLDTIRSKRCYRCSNPYCKCSKDDECTDCIQGKYNISSFCQHNCSRNCATCFSSNDCADCLLGKYGEFCQSDCITTCSDGSCDKDSGYCQHCQNGQYLDNMKYCQKCQARCSTCTDFTTCMSCNNTPFYKWGSTCQYDCTGCSNSQCSKNDGCSSGCDDNYYQTYNNNKNGYECIHCPAGCLTCTNATLCLSCAPDTFGRICQHKCLGCTGQCDTADGACYVGCTFGYYQQLNDGKKYCVKCMEGCELCLDKKSCVRCKAGFYLEDEEGCVKCPENCKNGTCHPTKGICKNGCENQWLGEYCNVSCASACLECELTNTLTCTACTPGLYGFACENNCSVNCKNEICNRINGSCEYGCIDGYWGSMCVMSCEVSCEERLCDDITGECTNGCDSTHYGEYCKNKCPENCKTDPSSPHTCNSSTGTCQWGCKERYFGINCTEECKNCKNNVCHQYNGTCKDGCATEFAGQHCTRINEVSTERQIDTNETNNAVLAGAAAGGAVFVIVVVVVVVLLVRKRRTTNEKKADDMSLERTDSKSKMKETTHETILSPETHDAPSTKYEHIVQNDESLISMTNVPETFSGHQNENITTEQKDEKLDKPISVHSEQKRPEDKHSQEVTKDILPTNTPKSNDEQVTVSKDDLSAGEQKHIARVKEAENNSADKQTNSEWEKQNKNDKNPNAFKVEDKKSTSLEENTYYNTSRKQIPVSDLAEYINKRDPEKSFDDFQKLPRGLLKPHNAAKSTRNTAKNRYKEVYPYDESRVILKDGGDDYINASYIKGHYRPREYIASSGPFTRKEKLETSTDFWRMIWQERSETIVMLTKCVEDKQHKCDQYWPELGESKVFGGLHVTGLTEDQYADFTIRSFVIRQDDETLNIRQIQFTGWPDKGVPTDVTSMIEYRQKVRSLHKDKVCPIVVHCSAGIGRTGTYIAIDILTLAGESRGYVDIFGCVASLRQQRTNLVQTPDQYEYIHHAILYALTFDCKSIPTETFITQYSGLVEKKDGLSEIETQFKKLVSTMHELSDSDKEAIARNQTFKDKNRDGADIPADDSRVSLVERGTQGGSDYINAVYINGYRTCNRFIAAQTPLPTTVIDFLAMIHQTNCSCVVMMEEPDLQEKTVGVFWPADNKVMKHGVFQVRCKESNTSQYYTLKKLSLIRRQEKKTDERDVSFFIYTNWSREAAVPKSSESLLHLIKDVDIANRQGVEERPIIIHCMSGAERSCLYCTVSVLVEKLEIEHEVSVVNTLRQIKARRRSAIPTLEQYKFCHQALISYLQTFDIYSNFRLRSKDAPAAGSDVVYSTVQK